MPKAEKNEMEVLAEAAFYVTDAVKGLLGTWTVEAEDWSVAEDIKARREFVRCMDALRESGWKDRKKIMARAPYRAKAKVGAYFKRFTDGRKRWITLVVFEGCGFHAEFEVHDSEPWT